MIFSLNPVFPNFFTASGGGRGIFRPTYFQNQFNEIRLSLTLPWIALLPHRKMLPDGIVNVGIGLVAGIEYFLKSLLHGFS
jgi:hypothetical protein